MAQILEKVEKVEKGTKRTFRCNIAIMFIVIHIIIIQIMFFLFASSVQPWVKNLFFYIAVILDTIRR